MKRYPPRRECDGSAARVAPSSDHDSLYVSLARSDLCCREETVRRRLLPIPSRTMASGLPVIGLPDWVTLSRDRTTIQPLDRKLRDVPRGSRSPLPCFTLHTRENPRACDSFWQFRKRFIARYFRLLPIEM